MPTIRRRSGPSYTASGGSIIEPRAMVHFCDGCNFEGAAYGAWRDGKLTSWCGWKDMKPICKGRGAGKEK